MRPVPPEIQTEMKTVAAMIRITCETHHGKKSELCGECQTLDRYAHQRLEFCRFGAEKPACIKCPVHCYKPDMRERIKYVMRDAGPKMMWRHPWLSLVHLWKEHLRPAKVVKV